MTEKKSETKKKVPSERRLSVFTTELPVVLTAAEQIDFGKRLAQLEIDLRNEDEHADAVKKDLQQRKGLLLVKRSSLAGIVRSGKEPRPVMVEAWARYKEGVYEEVRTDTGEVLQQTRRRLMEEERQVPLPLSPVDKSIADLKRQAADLGATLSLRVNGGPLAPLGPFPVTGELTDSEKKQQAKAIAAEEKKKAKALAQSLVDGTTPARKGPKKAAGKDDAPKPAA